jgi:hypothetical protein
MFSINIGQPLKVPRNIVRKINSYRYLINNVKISAHLLYAVIAYSLALSTKTSRRLPGNDPNHERFQSILLLSIWTSIRSILLSSIYLINAVFILTSKMRRKANDFHWIFLPIFTYFLPVFEAQTKLTLKCQWFSRNISVIRNSLKFLRYSI